jgi:catechol-2,3-dioxygenase
VPITNQVQLFFHDPAGNGVELGFDAADGSS